MKPIVTICAFLAMTFIAHSQKNMFLRVFDESGKKANKGFLAAVSDSSLTIENHGKMIEIPVSKMSVIKGKRSFGHTVLVSSGMGAATFAIAGVVTADPDEWFGYTEGEGAASGFL